jgi:hypothetical protein
MRWIVLPICSLLGIWFTVRSARRQWQAWKLNPPEAAERWLNVPFTIVWYAFLAAFCVGLSVNNLLLR